MVLQLLVLIAVNEVSSRAPFLRDRPRGLGLLQLPTGMTDERSAPFFPNLYMAGDKAGEKPAAVPDVHLPGQMAVFSGRSAFNPFTHAVAATYNEDLVDSWGTGFAVNGVNNYNLQVRRNFDQYADAPLDRNDGMYQPFITAGTVGGEYDLSKIREVAVRWLLCGHSSVIWQMAIDLGSISMCHMTGDLRKVAISRGTEYIRAGSVKLLQAACLVYVACIGHFDLPIPGVNELFDFDGRLMLKGFGNGILNSAMEFPLTFSDPSERAPYTFKYLNFMADRHMQYGHVLPNVNLFLVGKDKIMSRLTQNTLNPTMIG